MKTQMLLLLVLVIFTNHYDGTIGVNTSQESDPTQQVASTLPTIMIMNETKNSLRNITTTEITTTNITLNTTTKPHQEACKKLEWESDAYFVLLILFAPIVFFGNLLVVVVVFSTRTLRNQPMYLFLASLAFSDCLIGIFLFPLRAIHSQHTTQFMIPPFLCWLFWLCDTLINMVSILHFVVVSVDRFIALKYTYQYSNMITRKRAIFIIVFIWCFSIGWVLLGIPQWTTLSPFDPAYKMSIYHTQKTGCGFWNPNYIMSTLTLWGISPIIVLFFIYSFIYRTALRHVNEISRLHVGDAEQIRRKKQLQLVRSIIAVFATYALCWLPMAVYNLWLFNNLRLARKLLCGDPSWFRILTSICNHLLLTVCPNANPFIYVLTNAAFVTALKRLIHRVTGIELGKKDNAIIHSEITRQTDEVDDSYQIKELADRSVGRHHTKYVTGTVNKGITNEEMF